MKKKVRAQTSTPSFYTTEPAVSRKLIAASQPTPSPSIGSKAPKTVDKKPSRMSGVAGFTSKQGPHIKAAKINVPAIGAKPPQQGKLRASGHSGAHRLGFKSKI